MQFTEICIDGDGIVTDVIDTNIRLTRSECRKKGFGSFDKILQVYEAVHPDKPVKKCKKQVVKKMEETVKVQEAKDVQDKNGQNVQQSAGSETEAGKKTGELENVDNCSGDNNGCGTADDLDNVAENLQED